MLTKFGFYRVDLSEALFPRTLSEALAAATTAWPHGPDCGLSMRFCQNLLHEDNDIVHQEDVELGRWDFIKSSQGALVLVRASGVGRFHPDISDAEIIHNIEHFLDERRRHSEVKTVINCSDDSFDIKFFIKELDPANDVFEIWIPRALFAQVS